MRHKYQEQEFIREREVLYRITQQQLLLMVEVIFCGCVVSRGEEIFLEFVLFCKYLICIFLSRCVSK